MAKLQAPSKPGFNAGDSYSVKYIRIDKIVIDPEIARLFKPSDAIVEELKNRIIKNGFNIEEPVTLWGDTLVDGHQRYRAAKEAGEIEIPFVKKDFVDRSEAIFYTFARQAVRRNLQGADLLTVAEMLSDKKAKNGEGREAENLAKRLGISASTIYKYSKVLKEASEEDLQDIRDGKTSGKKVYNKIKQSKKPETGVKEVCFNAAAGLPANVSFLKGAVILLVESKHEQSAEILISHFLRKNERHGFYELLPDAIKEQLSNAIPEH